MWIRLPAGDNDYFDEGSEYGLHYLLLIEGECSDCSNISLIDDLLQSMFGTRETIHSSDESSHRNM